MGNLKVINKMISSSSLLFRRNLLLAIIICGKLREVGVFCILENLSFKKKLSVLPIISQTSVRQEGEPSFRRKKASGTGLEARAS